MHNKRLSRISTIAVIGLIALFIAIRAFNQQDAFDRGIDKINHVVVIYLENHSFDNLYGQFPGADGSNGTDSSIVQLGPDNKPYRFLPPVGKVFPAAAFPINLDNKCFNIDQYVPSFMEIPDV